MTKKSSIDIQSLERLIEIFNEGSLAELEYTHKDDVKVRLVKNTENFSAAAPWTANPAFSSAAASYAVPALAEVPASAAPAGSKVAAVDASEEITSPVVGTVYVAPKPGDPPFVQVGDDIKEGQTLMIIESMKVMNPVKAAKAGRVTQIFVKNTDPIEFGEPLLQFEPL